MLQRYTTGTLHCNRTDGDALATGRALGHVHVTGMLLHLDPEIPPLSLKLRHLGLGK
jgi:hypothetical protein